MQLSKFLKLNSSPVFLSSLLILAGCATQAPGPSASADLMPTKGNATAGSVSFKQVGSKVLVTAEVKGLKPNAEHGFHIHEKGDCSSGDGMSTGGHFNPTAQACAVGLKCPPVLIPSPLEQSPFSWI